MDVGAGRLCKMDKVPQRDGGSGSGTVWKIVTFIGLHGRQHENLESGICIDKII